VMVGSSIAATRATARLSEQGIDVQPILYPAVPEGSARLRFFLSAAHSQGQIEQAVTLTAAALREAARDRVPFATLARLLRRPPDAAPPDSAPSDAAPPDSTAPDSTAPDPAPAGPAAAPLVAR